MTISRLRAGLPVQSLAAGFLKYMSEKYSLPFSQVGPSVNVNPSASFCGFASGRDDLLVERLLFLRALDVVGPHGPEDVELIGAGVAELRRVHHAAGQVQHVARRARRGKRSDPSRPGRACRGSCASADPRDGCAAGTRSPGSMRTRLICAFFPQMSRDMRRAAPVRLPGHGIGQRRPLNLVQVDDDAGLERRRDALIRKRRVHAGRVLSGQREMIEPHRRIDLERLPPVRAGLDRSRGAGLQVEHLVLRRVPRSCRRTRSSPIRPATMMISSSPSVCAGYAAPGCISTRSRSAPRPQPSAADTPGAIVMVGSLVRSTGSPSASSHRHGDVAAARACVP